MSARVFSYGGGVQSTAALVLAAWREIDFPIFLFANVGDDSENPETLSYIDDVALPYAVAHQIQLTELKRTWRDGRKQTLYGQLMETERDGKSRTGIPIPVRLASGAPGLRNCTWSFKIEVIAKWMKRIGGATENDKGIVGLGISVDEFQRMRTSSGVPHYDLEYPLIDLRLDRANCEAIIRREGLPIPPKSSCWFCPYHTLATWRRMKQDNPDMFRQAIQLEERLNEKRTMQGKDAVYMTDALVPLDQAVGDHQQLDLFTDDNACESGFCMT